MARSLFSCFCCAIPAVDEQEPRGRGASFSATNKASDPQDSKNFIDGSTTSKKAKVIKKDVYFETESKSSEKVEFMIADRFQVFQQIGHGSFGKVHAGRDMETNEEVAIKILKQKGHHSFYRETNILGHLENTNGVPRIYWQGRLRNQDILIVNRLGNDLSQLFDQCGQKFSLATTCSLGVQMVKLLQNVHEKGIVHRDIKPHNFLVGYKEQRHKLYLIDFGLAKSFRSSPSKQDNTSHQPMQRGLMPVGTARYASVWTHAGVSHSRRDDLESVGFVLVYFLITKLPWQGLRLSSKADKWKKIGSVKAKTKLEYLCRGIPEQFQVFLRYIRTLQYKEEPNYQFLVDLLIEAARENGVENIDQVAWDWED